ncbi:hypothetical protein CXU13_01335 [Akkermansia muciniphila]|nr:hypothetical protein CXU12_12945 [Akkermansia muciniphila]PNC61277.1 hypothetical protein CXU13_01335 [Akkermansia muciniphila]
MLHFVECTIHGRGGFFRADLVGQEQEIQTDAFDMPYVELVRIGEKNQEDTFFFKPAANVHGDGGFRIRGDDGFLGEL